MTAVHADLLALAPTTLASRRPARFDGSGFEVPLARFEPADRAALRTVYAAVAGVRRVRRAMGERPDYAALEATIRRAAGPRLMDTAHALGEATRAAGRADPAVVKAVHDVRGGGLAVFLGSADLLAVMPGDESLVRMCADAARDHAKIMRNLLPDIDPPTRAADEAEKPHGIDHFTDKWAGASVGGPAGPVAVAVRCSFAGAVSARCLETASIDRVVYNLVNNAARFAADRAVTLWVFPVAPGLTRWVVENRIAPDQAAFLTDRVGGDLGRLFAGGVTRGGTGVGLANCAEIVADCFGLESPGEAVGRGYLGAAAVNYTYRAWFHWPVAPGGPRTLGPG